MFSVIKKINHHQIQSIKANEFIQGSGYVKKKYLYKNVFIPIYQQNVSTKHYSFIEIIIKLWMGHSVYDINDQKNYFSKILSEYNLNSLSRHHKVLKQQIYDIIYEKNFVIPSRIEILQFFGNILEKNIFIKNTDKTYLSVIVNMAYPIIFIQSSSKFGIFADDEIENELKRLELVEYKEVNKLNREELVTFACALNIPIEKQKKQDLINSIERMLKKN